MQNDDPVRAEAVEASGDADSAEEAPQVVLSWMQILGLGAAGFALSIALRRLGEPYWGHLPQVVQAVIRITLALAIIAGFAVAIPAALRFVRGSSNSGDTRGCAPRR